MVADPSTEGPASIPPGEFGWIEWIRRQQAAQLAGAYAAVQVGPGDDCAVLSAGDGPAWLATLDMLLEGTHFRWDEASAEEVGYKLVAVNVSDVAAMGGVPRFAMVGVGFAPGPPDDLKAELYYGLRRGADAFGVALVGGDVTAWPPDAAGSPGLALSLALLGQMDPGVAPVLRATARPGDVVAVTGALGGSRLGRHLSFTPRVEPGRFLARHGFARAMIDISDGLAADLGHICDESGVGVRLDGPAVPLSSAARSLAQASDREPLDHALHDGEDFELCVAVPPDRWDELTRVWPFASDVPITKIGAFVDAAEGRRLVGDDGVERPLAGGGWDHLRG